MILSDSPDCQSGLGRIARDVATIVSRMPEFRVAVMGRGGRGSARLPFPQFVFGESEGWGASVIEECWLDFAGNEQGVLLPIWDNTRLRYLVSKDGLPDDLVKFLDSGRFARWLYCPVDASGPNNRLSGMQADTIKRFDRVLAYTLWGKQVIENSIGREVDWCPHGINGDVFQPRDKAAGRLAMGFHSSDTVIGMVATNQARKDWGIAFCAIAELRKHRPGIKFWIHTDVLVRHWDIRALVADYHLEDIVKVTMSRTLSDPELAVHYSACDITMLPSAEGFGFPLVESLACGVPVVHGNYAGGAEFIPNREWLVEPLTYRLESRWNCLRPVFDPGEWKEGLERALDSNWSAEQCRASVEHLFWKNLSSVWRKWLLSGIGVGQ